MSYALKVGNKWYIGFTDRHGRPQRKTSPATTRTEARRLAAEKEAKEKRIALGLETPDVERVLFGDVAKLYLQSSEGKASHESTEARFRLHILPVFEHKFMDEIRPADVERFLAAKSKEARCRRHNDKGGCVWVGTVADLGKPCPRCGAKVGPVSAGTRERLRVNISGLYTYAITKEECYRGKNPAAGVEVEGELATIRPLQAEWIPPVILQVRPYWRNLFATAVYTGIRKGELLALRRPQVNLKHRFIEVLRSGVRKTTKGKKVRYVPIPPELVPYLEDQLSSHDSEFVFPNAAGEQQQKCIKFEKLLRTALKRAGILQGFDHVCRRKDCGFTERRQDNAGSQCPKCKFRLWAVAVPVDFDFKDLRATFGTYATEMTGDIRFTQQGLGHQDIATTERHYAKLRNERLLTQADNIRFGASPLNLLTAGASGGIASTGEALQTLSPQVFTQRARRDSNPRPSDSKGADGQKSDDSNGWQEGSLASNTDTYELTQVSRGGDWRQEEAGVSLNLLIGPQRHGGLLLTHMVLGRGQ